MLTGTYNRRVPGLRSVTIRPIGPDDAEAAALLHLDVWEEG